MDNNDDGSCAYDLESLAIDARGWDDGKEAIEVGRTASFGYAETTRGDNRRRKKLSSAEEANAVPRSDRRKSWVIGGGGFSDRGGRLHDFGMPRLADVGRRRHYSVCAAGSSGEEGGACTAALLEALRGDGCDKKSWVEVLAEMRGMQLVHFQSQTHMLHPVHLNQNQSSKPTPSQHPPLKSPIRLQSVHHISQRTQHPLHPEPMQETLQDSSYQ